MKLLKVFYKCCCGIDVHRSVIKANLRRVGVKGKKNLDEVRKFGTMTRDLLELADWLKVDFSLAPFLIFPIFVISSEIGFPIVR
jgi:hypothetical protein